MGEEERRALGGKVRLPANRFADRKLQGDGPGSDAGWRGRSSELVALPDMRHAERRDDAALATSLLLNAGLFGHRLLGAIEGLGPRVAAEHPRLRHGGGREQRDDEGANETRHPVQHSNIDAWGEAALSRTAIPITCARQPADVGSANGPVPADAEQTAILRTRERRPPPAGIGS